MRDGFVIFTHKFVNIVMNNRTVQARVAEDQKYIFKNWVDKTRDKIWVGV